MIFRVAAHFPAVLPSMASLFAFVVDVRSLAPLADEEGHEVHRVAISNIREAIKHFINLSLAIPRPGLPQQISVIAIRSKIETLVPPQRLAASKIATLHEALNRLES